MKRQAPINYLCSASPPRLLNVIKMSTEIANILVVMGYAMARTLRPQEELMMLRYDSYAASYPSHISQAESPAQAQACRFGGMFSP